MSAHFVEVKQRRRESFKKRVKHEGQMEEKIESFRSEGRKISKKSISNSCVHERQSG